MTEKKAHLVRQFGNEKQTLGTFSTVKPNGELWMAKSLELPWDANISNVSCIPTGIYLCTYSRSNRLSLAAGRDIFTYEVLNVPNRAGIRLHSANYFFQLRGCIALGSAFKDLNVDMELDVIHSGKTMAKFVEIMGKQDFTLFID